MINLPCQSYLVPLLKTGSTTYIRGLFYRSIFLLKIWISGTLKKIVSLHISRAVKINASWSFLYNLSIAPFPSRIIAQVKQVNSRAAKLTTRHQVNAIVRAMLIEKNQLSIDYLEICAWNCKLVISIQWLSIEL